MTHEAHTYPEAETSTLTKREHFAALALQGLLTKYTLKEPSDQKTITELSVQIADELINQLNSKP